MNSQMNIVDEEQQQHTIFLSNTQKPITVKIKKRRTLNDDLFLKKL
jgi:hypothetical protein